MKDNNFRFLVKCIELISLGCEARTVVESIKNIYLIGGGQVEGYLNLIECSDFRDLKTLSQVQIWKNYISAYPSMNIFGVKQDEALLLDAKVEAFKKLNIFCENEEYTQSSLLSSISSDYVKSLVGFGCICDLFNVGDKNYGNEMIKIAAKHGDIDAKLYELTLNPDRAVDILTDIANTREYSCGLSGLKAWLNFYGIQEQEIKINRTIANKMGFSWV